MYANGTLPPYPRKVKGVHDKEPPAPKPIEEYRTKYGTSSEWICPRCEERPVYMRKTGSRWLARADCCLPCRRAEQALADYWRDIGLPLAYFNENPRVSLRPIRRKPVVTIYQSLD